MNNKRTEIICCGHAAWDMNFLMDEYPVEDQKYRVDRLLQSGGGPAANAASLLAKWGASSAWAGLVGDDIYGRLILEELAQWGVNTELAQLDKSKNTPLSAVIVNTTGGTRTILNRRNPEDQPAVGAEVKARLSHFSPSVLHFDGHALELSLLMMDLFPQAKTILDAGSFRDATRQLSQKVDYVICSRRFAEDSTGLADFSSPGKRQRCMDLLLREYDGTIVVTMGADGLFYSSENPGSKNTGFMEALKVKAVDSTAAGDIFHAAFSYGLLRSWEFKDNLHFASAAAAVSVGREGGKPSIPTLKEVQLQLNSV